VGIYVDEQGRVPLLPACYEVEQALARQEAARLSADRRPAGLQPAHPAAAVRRRDRPLLAAGRVATAQTIGGSGALRVAADLLKQVPVPARRSPSAARAGAIIM
jgi:aromatic-amino-acid transaminase